MKEKRSLLGSFAFFAKNGGSSAFPLKIASPLSRPPTLTIWGLEETRCGSSTALVQKGLEAHRWTRSLGERARAGTGWGAVSEDLSCSPPFV